VSFTESSKGVNPQGVQVPHFGIPTPEELDHDFLWRYHKWVPGRGELVVFNRSHYEGVLVERVHKLVPEEVWAASISGDQRLRKTPL